MEGRSLLGFADLQTIEVEANSSLEEFTIATVSRIDLELIIAGIAAVHTLATKAIRSLQTFFDSFEESMHSD